MILVGSQRGGARNLAAHLMNAVDNDHVRVVSLRGFMADDLRGSLDEARAIAKGTRCTQFMFSLSINPPKDGQAKLDDLLNAAERAEERLGLQGQPRAIVSHEKQGRRHIHVVWSRIDVERMTAINLPFFKTKLRELSRELYLDHGWALPDGHKTNGWKSPLNFSLAEWQQAKRLDLDPREIKQVFQSAWAASDNLASFKNALEEHGFFLAQGDRRGFVALDIHGEVLSVARWAGIKTKDLNAKLGKPDALPTVAQSKADTEKRLTAKLRDHLENDRADKDRALEPLLVERDQMVAAQRAERITLEKHLRDREQREVKARTAKFRRGLGAVFDFLTRKTSDKRRDNEREAYAGLLRDRGQREDLFLVQNKDRQKLQERIDALRTQQRQERMRLARQIASVLRIYSREPPQRQIVRAPGLEFSR